MKIIKKDVFYNGPKSKEDPSMLPTHRQFIVKSADGVDDTEFDLSRRFEDRKKIAVIRKVMEEENPVVFGGDLIPSRTEWVMTADDMASSLEDDEVNLNVTILDFPIRENK